MAEGREGPSFQLPPSAYYLKDWKEVERPDRATVLLAQATICSSDTSNLQAGREGGKGKGTGQHRTARERRCVAGREVCEQ